MLRTNNKLSNKLARKMLAGCGMIILITIVMVFILVLPLFIKDAKKNAQDGVEQLAKDYADLLEKMEENSSLICKSSEFSTLLRNYEENSTSSNFEKIRIYLGSIRSSNPDILYIMAEDEKKNMFTSLRFPSDKIDTYIHNDPYYKELYSNSGSYCSPIYDSSKGSTKKKDSIYSYPFTFYTKKDQFYNKNYMITICSNQTEFIARENLIMKPTMDDYILVDNNHQVIYSSSDDLRERIAENNLLEQTVSIRGTIKKDGGYYFYKRISQNNHLAITYASWVSLMKNFIFMLLAVFASLVIPIILYYVIIIKTNNKYLEPIKVLATGIAQFSIGDEPNGVLYTEDEIEDLSKVINQLETKVNIQSSEIVNREKEKAIAIYQKLILQISPHFVCNTLNIINILARQGDTENIIKINNAITRILREHLNTTIHIYTTISEEVSLLKQYMIIMEYRYKNSVQVEYNIDENIKDKLIIKNILQPLVENALYHGLTNDDGIVKGNISVMIYYMDSQIIIEISDDGKGMEPEKSKRLNETNFKQESKKGDASIGLENIYERLVHIYSKGYSMQINGIIGHGTTVVLTLPIIESDEK